MIKVYPIGSGVLIDREIPGTVVAVTLRGKEHSVCYTVEWWDGRKVEVREFDAFRLSPGREGVTPATIGFMRGSDEQNP